MISGLIIVWALFLACELSFRMAKAYVRFGVVPQVRLRDFGTSAALATMQTMQFTALAVIVLWCIGKAL